MTAFGSPTFRAAYVEATGEIYVMQHEGLPGGGRVEVVATRAAYDDVLADLGGMDQVCGEPGSLRWLLDRLGPGDRAGTPPVSVAHRHKTPRAAYAALGAASSRT